MSAKAGSAWMGSSVPGGVTVPRGPWHYDGEIDLGFGGALRMAATVVTNDPAFGWIAYGGIAKEDGKRLAINPRDGVRRRLAVVMPRPDGGDPLAAEGGTGARRLRVGRRHLGGQVARRIAFTVENRTPTRTARAFDCRSRSGPPTCWAEGAPWRWSRRGSRTTPGGPRST